jgi:hypothetical protein
VEVNTTCGSEKVYDDAACEEAVDAVPVNWHAGGLGSGEVPVIAGAALITVAVDNGCADGALVGCARLLLVSGLQALTKATNSKTLVRLNKILRRRFMLDLLYVERMKRFDRSRRNCGDVLLVVDGTCITAWIIARGARTSMLGGTTKPS